MVALGYVVLNVAVICDSTWSWGVPVAALVAAFYSTGMSTVIPGSVLVVASYPSGIGNDMIGAVEA